MTELEGKVVLVTGGAAGIGRGYCQALAKRGNKVSVCDIDQQTGEELVQSINREHGPGSAIFCFCDVTNQIVFEGCFKKTISTLGGLDVVVNNAGMLNDSANAWEKEIDINLKGVIRGTLLAMKYLKHGGAVLNTASINGLRPSETFPIYGATKFAIVGFTRSLGTPFHHSLNGVRVMALCPAGVETNLSKSISGSSTKFLDSRIAQIYKLPMNRLTLEEMGTSLLHILEEGDNGSVWDVVAGRQPLCKKVDFQSFVY